MRINDRPQRRLTRRQWAFGFVSALVLGAPAQVWAAEGDEVAASAEAAGANAAEGAVDVDELVVTGLRQAVQLDAGPLGARTILETPFAVGVADAEQITRIGATTIDAAFNYDASIRPNNSGVAAGNTFSVRGLSVDLTNGYKYDGLAFPYWYQDHPIEAVEQIQVLKGSGGFIYGYASPAGIVNFIPKKPTGEFRSSANLSFRSSNIWRAHADVGGPFSDGSSAAFRLNVVHEEGRLYNGAENKNQFATLWLEGDITPDLTWSLDGFYQRTWQARQSNNISLAAGVTNLRPVGGDLNLGALSTTKWNDIAQITGRLNYQISPNWKTSAALRYSTLDERFPGNNAQILNNDGDYRIGLLNQNRIFYYYVGQLNLEGSFNTGPIAHNFITGLDYLDVNFDYDYQPFTANGRPTTSYAFGLTGNIYDDFVPDWGTNPAALAFQRPPDWFRYQEIRQRGLFVSDTLSLGRWELLAGGRYTWYEESNYEPVIASTFYDETAFTPVISLSYDLADGARAYVTHVEALQRGATAPDTALNFGDSFGPLKSKQYEAGLKVQRGAWGATLAAFRTYIPSEFVTSPAPGETQGRFVRDGERRYQGIEFDANLRPNAEWFFNVSAAYLDAVQTKAQSADLVGQDVPGRVKLRTSALVEYAPSYVPGFKVWGGIRYAGKAYGQANNTFTYPSYTVGDLGASYAFDYNGRDLELRAILQNVTDEKYWVPNAGGTGLSAGAPRTFTLSVAVTDGTWGRGVGSLGGGGAPKDAGWYVGLEGGGGKLGSSSYDIISRLDPALGEDGGALKVKHKAAWEFAGTIGYDFGRFRGELEGVHQQADLKQVTLNSARIPISSPAPAAGVYDDPSGTTAISAFLFNGLVDIGGGSASPWAFEAGAGFGLARVNSHKWRLEDAADPSFQRDNKTTFAWQAIAGTRRRVTDRVELTLSYRYFNVPELKLFTSNANGLKGELSTHSLVAGAVLNF